MKFRFMFVWYITHLPPLNAVICNFVPYHLPQNKGMAITSAPLSDGGDNICLCGLPSTTTIHGNNIGQGITSDAYIQHIHNKA